MQKIKWALLMIQTILLNNFIVVATLFVLSKTIKIWHEIRHKPHIEKQVVVYDNVHHGAADNAEHSDYEEGHSHGHGWGWWGRSFQNPNEAANNGEQDYDNEYYQSNNRVTRSARSPYGRYERPEPYKGHKPTSTSIS